MHANETINFADFPPRASDCNRDIIKVEYKIKSKHAALIGSNIQPHLHEAAFWNRIFDLCDVPEFTNCPYDSGCKMNPQLLTLFYLIFFLPIKTIEYHLFSVYKWNENKKWNVCLFVESKCLKICMLKLNLKKSRYFFFI